MGAAVDQLGQAGIGLHRDAAGPVLAEPFDVLGHLARAGGAVEADDRHVERVDDRRGGGDVGADQEGAGRLDRHLDDDRQSCLPRFLARPLGAVDRRLDLQRVLAGLDQDRIDAAGDQPGALDRQRVFEVLVGDVAERGQPRARPDRAEHEAGAAVMREFGDRLARQLGGAAVEGEGLVGDAELAERDRRAAEAVGLDRVGAGLEIAEVDLADEIRAALAQDLGAVLVAAENRARYRESRRLHLGAHRPVAQQHPVGEIVEKMGHRIVSLARRETSVARVGAGPPWIRAFAGMTR